MLLVYLQLRSQCYNGVCKLSLHDLCLGLIQDLLTTYTYALCQLLLQVLHCKKTGLGDNIKAAVRAVFKK